MFSFLIQQVKISAGNARVIALDAGRQRSHTIKSRPSNEHKWKFEIRVATLARGLRERNCASDGAPTSVDRQATPALCCVRAFERKITFKFPV